MRSTLAQLSFALSVLRSTSAYLVDPPTTALPDTNELCSAWQIAEEGWHDCNNVANANGLPITLVGQWNPSCKNTANFVIGNSYCIEVNFGVPEPTPTPKPTSSTPATPTNGIATPSPIQKGMTSNCNKFYLVAPGDGCYDIATANSISTDDFYAWNTAIGTNCAALWANTYVCVGIIGGAGTTPKPTATPTPTPATPTSTPAGNGIATPSPVQPSMVANCNKFYLVKAGDGCYDIAAANSISLDQFYAFNPYVQTDCSRLWGGYNVCVGVVGQSASTPTPTPTPTPAKPTSTSVGNGIATPSPVQPSTAPNCNLFYLVKAGDGCYDIAASNSISLDQFYAWNPYVNSDCSRLWSGYNVCIRTIGFTPPKTTLATSTKPASSTPTPVQAGMVGGCKKFYQVKSGDGCWAIADASKISLDDFYKWNPSVKTDCSGLWGGYYVCVGI